MATIGAGNANMFQAERVATDLLFVSSIRTICHSRTDLRGSNLQSRVNPASAFHPSILFSFPAQLHQTPTQPETPCVNALHTGCHHPKLPMVLDDKVQSTAGSEGGHPPDIEPSVFVEQTLVSGSTQPAMCGRQQNGL